MTTFWLTILLTFLPKALEYLLGLISKGKSLKGKTLKQYDQVVWYCEQIRTEAPKAGCAVGGTPPEVSGILDDLASYTDIIDRAVALFEALARRTGKKWDDQLAAGVRLLFEQLIGGRPPVGLEGADGAPTLDEEGAEFQRQVAALPSWVLPLALRVIALLTSW